jgi:hypothetical protein
MKKKLLIVVSLVIVAVIAGLFVIRDVPSSLQSDDSLSPVSSFNSSSSDNRVEHRPSGVTTSDINRSKQQADVDANNDSIPAELQETYAEVSDNPDYPQLQDRLDAMQKRHVNKSFDAEQVTDALARPDAWVRVDTPPAELPLTAAEKFDGREFIRFNPTRIETLMPGDTLEIPVWQLGERFTMRVERTETHANGSVTWHGHLDDFSEPHRVTITVGDGLSLGGIDTPNGHYVLQAHGKSGWIASSETLFKRSETETDMVIPPDDELEESP